MCQILILEDPDVITGHNILKYDFPYCDSRLKKRGIREWPNFSRLKNYTVTSNMYKYKTKQLGDQVQMWPDCPGRVSIDIYPVIERDYKLLKYTLNYVSEYFLGQSKHDVSAAYMFETYDLLRIGGYGIAVGNINFFLLSHQCCFICNYSNISIYLCLWLVFITSVYN